MGWSRGLQRGSPRCGRLARAGPTQQSGAIGTHTGVRGHHLPRGLGEVGAEPRTRRGRTAIQLDDQPLPRLQPRLCVLSRSTRYRKMWSLSRPGRKAYGHSAGAKLSSSSSSSSSHINTAGGRLGSEGWLKGRGWRASIAAGIWPVRWRVVIPKVITLWSSADLKRSPLGVVLDSPFVAANYATQISHGSPTSASVWMALRLHGSGRTRLRVRWRACVCYPRVLGKTRWPG